MLDLLSAVEGEGQMTTNKATIRVLPGADVDHRARVGDGTRVWHLAQIREHATVGSRCTIGRGAYLGPGVRLGRHVKVQNYALVYDPAELGDGEFVGPAAVLTNDTYPRAVTPDGRLKGNDDWTAVGVLVGEGAAIGARAVCMAPVRIGHWAMVAAGAVVIADVPTSPSSPAHRPGLSDGWVEPECG